MYRLDEASGVRVGASGLFHGPVRLVGRSTAGDAYRPRDAAWLKRRLCIKTLPRAEGLQAVANALNKGDIGLAQIAALHLRLEPFSPAMLTRLAKANFDPSEPRDDHGRWTSGDGNTGNPAPPPHRNSLPASKPSLAESVLGITPAEAQTVPPEEIDPREEDRPEDNGEVLDDWELLNYRNSLDSLRRLDPQNQLLSQVTTLGRRPTQEDLDAVNSELERISEEQSIRGLPPKELVPPVSNPDTLRIENASRPSEVAKGGKSLWDEYGGEWRYFPGDKYHNPHWDYNSHQTKSSEWENITIADKPTHK